MTRPTSSVSVSSTMLAQRLLAQRADTVMSNRCSPAGLKGHPSRGGSPRGYLKLQALQGSRTDALSVRRLQWRRSFTRCAGRDWRTGRDLAGGNGARPSICWRSGPIGADLPSFRQSAHSAEGLIRHQQLLKATTERAPGGEWHCLADREGVHGDGFCHPDLL